MSFPISVAMAHAGHGHREHIATELFSQLEAFMENFEAKLKENGKDDDFIRTTYLGTLRWIGCMMTFHYFMKIHMDHLPLDDVPEEDQAKVFGSIGYIGLKLHELTNANDCKADNMSHSELKDFFLELVTTEINELSAATVKRRARPLRPSMLRISGTRISDAGELEMYAARMSEQLAHLDNVDE
jgi:hypothetical protein